MLISFQLPKICLLLIKKLYKNSNTSQDETTVSLHTVLIYFNTFVSRMVSHITCMLLALHVTLFWVLWRWSDDGQV